MKSHKLKCEIEYFQKVLSGDKNFELRFNDRNFQEGDQLILEEWDKENQQYTGYSTSRIVLYMLENAEQFGLKKGFCLMSFIKP